MRDCNVSARKYEDALPDPQAKSLYKEVIIVGNGPSGITLSYLLNGHSPFYNRKAHPDPMLSARLIECTQKSLLHQDLSFLSQGIEGRSKNPVSLLIDAMTHPGADMGLEWPSLLTWKKTHKSVDHLALGKGQPGGAWQGIAENVLTISPGRWMSLPGLELEAHGEGRAPAPAVFRYYNEYIKKHGLEQNMVNNTTVTSVLPISSPTKRRARWRVCVREDDGSCRTYECRHLVLATGASDRAGCLGVAGESLPFVTHDLKGLEERLAMPPSPPASPRIDASASSSVRSSKFRRRQPQSQEESCENGSESRETVDNGRQPLLIVGAGLSAADAILMARNRGVPVVHAFRSARLSQPLPAVMYPEYHEVYQLMQGLSSSPDYTALPGYQVTEFCPDNYVCLADGEGNQKELSIVASAVLIGSQPDLSFLPPKLRNLGIDENKPVDCKANPIEIEPFSYRCMRAPHGLYALGPLVGDNFVRFLQGGAIAIASHIYKENSMYRDL